MTTNIKRKIDNSSTLTASVYEQIRGDILEGVYAPNEKLPINGLAQRYQVGASPIREALTRLSTFRLVVQTERRGFRVADMSRQKIFELTKTRCWISEIAIREAIAHGDQQWEEQIVLAHHKLWVQPAQDNGPMLDKSWNELHRAFHSALIAACPSHWIRDLHEQLFDEADYFRNLAANLVIDSDLQLRDPIDEHQNIMRAVVQRNAALAIELLNEHFMLTSHLANTLFPQKTAEDTTLNIDSKIAPTLLSANM